MGGATFVHGMKQREERPRATGRRSTLRAASAASNSVPSHTNVRQVSVVPAVVVLQWPTFQDAADEAGFSRRYGGIHFQDADLRSRAMGRQIGEQALAVAEEYWTGRR
jgi:hypothetical protein